MQAPALTSPSVRRGPSRGDAETDSKTPSRLAAAVLLVVALVLATAGPTTAVPADGVRWIVRAAPGALDDAMELVSSVGGEIVLPLPIIDGFSAVVPAGTAEALAADPAVAAVTPDGRIELTGFESGPPADGGAMHRIVDKVVQADTFWERGFTGAGIDVAIIDSGIAPVAGMDDPGKVVNGPDISFDSIHPNLAHLDLFGHGTHMASIIAGRDGAAGDEPSAADLRDSYLGVAPGARIVSVKVADARGLADVSQVIAAIDWVVQHRDDPVAGLDIRVLGLAFGTDGTQDRMIDPLSYAAEVAWHRGIVVVAAAGNDGNDRPLRNPASNPFVIAVGAADTAGTYGTGDDTVLPFSNCGDDERTVDLVAPGRSLLGLRVPGSFIDSEYAEQAAFGARLFRGTGTSQASAVVAGGAALVLDQRPELSPDQVKALLTSTARPIPGSSGACQGAGVLDLKAAFKAATPADVGQPYEPGTGTGTLEDARGTHHLVHDGEILEGEVDIFGNAWDGASWSGASWSGASWSGGDWNGASWSGASWSGASWSGASWSGASWSGASWSGASWSGASWSGASWSGASWSGASWSGASWSGASWSGASWSASSWS